MIARFSRTRKLLAAVGVATSVAAATAPAFAASINMTGGPAQVEYPSTALWLQYSGTNYITTSVAIASNTTTCTTGVPAASADTVKIWASLAQAALLSGKTLTVYYTVCNSTNYIQDIVLIK